VALRDGSDEMAVNWFEIQIINATSETTYRNSFVTSSFGNAGVRQPNERLIYRSVPTTWGDGRRLRRSLCDVRAIINVGHWMGSALPSRHRNPDGTTMRRQRRTRTHLDMKDNRPMANQARDADSALDLQIHVRCDARCDTIADNVVYPTILSKR
jgi:hypothetical protein